LPGKTRFRNGLLCVKWDVKPYTLTHSFFEINTNVNTQLTQDQQKADDLKS